MGQENNEIENYHKFLTEKISPFIYGPAGAFEREPTVLNPVTTSKP